MVKQLGALIAILNFEGVRVDEFNDWYDTEHIPERLRVPGVLSAQRWLSADGKPLSVGIYDLDSVQVLNSAPYQAIAGKNLSPWSKHVIGACRRFSRYEAEQVFPGAEHSPEGAGGLYLSAINIEPSKEAEFNGWYDAEYLRKMSALPGVLCVRKYVTTEGEHRYVTLCHLASASIAESESWMSNVEGPLAAKTGTVKHDHMRILCSSYQRMRG